MKYLFDTSVWIENFRKGNNTLLQRLEDNNVVINEIIIGELSAGNIPHRKQTLNDLLQLTLIPLPSLEEMIIFVDTHRLYALGLSWSDLQIMASAIIAKVELVTLDKKLKRSWEKINQ